jgi:hypothetical protein
MAMQGASIMNHIWRQDGYEIAGYLGDNKFLSPIQKFRCENCDETVALPDCRHSLCLNLLSPGCPHTKTKKKWQAPMPKREFEEKRDYPAKFRKGIRR